MYLFDQLTRRHVGMSSALFFFACTLFSGSAQATTYNADLAASAKSRAALGSQYGQLPLSFEENRGQTDPKVRFLSRGEGYSLFLTDTEAVLRLGVGKLGAKKSDVVRMQLQGTKGVPHVEGAARLPGTANYFLGNEPSKWQRGVPTFGKVRYQDVYSGVDLVYYGNQRHLEYDFEVAPGADPKAIRLRFQGVRQLEIGPDGDLQVAANNGSISFARPVAYQEVEGERRLVDGRFALVSKNTVGFVLGRYDRGRELIIDPTLTYATYLGGSGFHPPAAPDCRGDSGNGITVDLFGSVYIVGTTGSTDFPISATAYQPKNHDSNDQLNGTAANVFVSKLDPTGSMLVYSTYLGGTGDYWYKDSGLGIAVDSHGDAYVTGYTGSSDFPVTAGAYQVENKAAAASDARSAFVTKLSANGSGLVYSTYLGGTGFNSGVARDGDFGTGIAVDASGNAFVIGSSYSQDFPVTSGAFQATNKAWPIRQSNPFVTKLNALGTARVYATYLGGTGISQGGPIYYYGADYGTGIAVDSSGDAYVTGYAHSSDFPVTPNAFQQVNRAHNGINGTGGADTNAFVTKFDPSGGALFYSTYIGGSGNPYYGDQAAGIAVDPAGYAYITGYAGSSDFPTTAGAFQAVDPMLYNQISGFVTKLDLDGSDLVYSTYLAGTGGYRALGDLAAGIAVNGSGEAYVVGTTISSDFPVTADAFQSTNKQSLGSDYFSGNAYITQFNASGSGLIYSSYFGGSGSSDGSGGDVGRAIAIDGGGNAYIGGSTLSVNLPATPGAFQVQNNAIAAGNPDSSNAFIAKFGIGGVLPLIPTTAALSADVNPQVVRDNVTFTASVSTLVGQFATGSVTFKVDGAVAGIVSLNSSGKASYSTASLAAGAHTILAAYSGSTVFAPSSAILTETVIASGSPSVGSVSPASGSGTSQTFTAVYYDSRGASALTNVRILFNTAINGVNACYVLYYPASNALYLENNADNGTIGPLSPGSSSAISNSQCTLAGTGSKVTVAGDTMTVSFALTFSSSFTGSRNVYLAAADASASSGWVEEGAWTPVSIGAPTVVSLSPSSGTGLTQAFSAVYSELSGVSYLNNVRILFNTSVTGVNACYVIYYPGSNALYLENDADNGTSGPLTPGSSGSLANDQCTLAGAGTSVSTSGDNITVNFALSFTSDFTGSKNVYLAAANNSASSSWVKKGIFTP